MTASERAQLRTHAKIAGWTAALNALPLETTIVQIVARDILADEKLRAEDVDRLTLACNRIGAAQEVLRGR
jgi:hypothetical protein